MKKLTAIIFTLLLSLSVSGMEVQQMESLLKKSNLSMKKLKENGHAVLLGEVTGAGLTIPTDRLEMLILKNELIKRRDIEGFELDKGANLGDLAGFTVKGKFLPMKLVQGFIIK
jgi:hypothetical protein